jgi:hypothetical protein
MALYRLLEEGRWIQLQLAPGAGAAPDASTIIVVSLAPGGHGGLFAGFASVLVHPDGYLAHVRPANDGRNAEAAA